MTNDLKLIAPTEPTATAAGKEGEREGEGEKGQVGQVGRWRCGSVGTTVSYQNSKRLIFTIEFVRWLVVSPLA